MQGCNGRSAIRIAFAMPCRRGRPALAQNIASTRSPASDHHRPIFTAATTTARRRAAPGLRLARMIGHITYVGRRMMEKFGRHSARTDPVPFRRRFRDRVHLRQGRQVLGVLRREPYCSSPERSTTSTAAAHENNLAGPCRRARPVSRRIVHFDWRLRHQRARNRQGAPGQPLRRVLPEIDAPPARCVPADDARYSARGATSRHLRAPMNGREQDTCRAAPIPGDRLLGQAGSTVLDLGCGDGTLLKYLKETRNARGTESTLRRQRARLRAERSQRIRAIRAGTRGFDAGSFDW